MSDVVPVVQADVVRALATFKGGLVREADERNTRGYTTHYHPEDTMRQVLAEYARESTARLEAEIERLRGEVGMAYESAAKVAETFPPSLPRERIKAHKSYLIVQREAIATAIRTRACTALAADTGEG